MPRRYWEEVTGSKERGLRSTKHLRSWDCVDEVEDRVFVERNWHWLTLHVLLVLEVT